MSVTHSKIYSFGLEIEQIFLEILFMNLKLFIFIKKKSVESAQIVFLHRFIIIFIKISTI